MRLNDEEQTRWKAALSESGRKELGAWVRQVVEDVLDERGGGPAPGGERRPVMLDPVSQAAYDELVRIGNNLNQLTRYTHQDGNLHRGLEAVLFEVGNAALVLRGIAPMDGTETADEDEA
ncbi:plasmid mobilization relaxosome protein MobC [Streptomyces sp. HJ7]